jgi:glycosyltransferase involved in cell wall biosynthesis
MSELRAPELRNRMGNNGRRYVRQHHQWDAVIGRFERLASRIRVQ